MKKNKKQHLLLVVLLVIVIGVVCGGIRMVQSRKSAESEPAFSLTISGVPISEEEYVQCMKRVRYDTKMELKGQKKDITEDTVWTETYADGQTGYEILAERTVEQLKYIHAVYDLAKEKGYIQDATFTGMKHRMEQENMQRSEKVARGEAVYGLKEYTLDLYQEYELSMIEEAYILDETNEGMGLTEEEIEAYYNTRDWIVGEDARKADLSEARAAVIDEMRRNRYQELTEQKAAVAEVDGDMDQLSQFTLKQL